MARLFASGARRYEKRGRTCGSVPRSASRGPRRPAREAMLARHGFAARGCAASGSRPQVHHDPFRAEHSAAELERLTFALRVARSSSRRSSLPASRQADARARMPNDRAAGFSVASRVIGGAELIANESAPRIAGSRALSTGRAARLREHDHAAFERAWSSQSRRPMSPEARTVCVTPRSRRHRSSRRVITDSGSVTDDEAARGIMVPKTATLLALGARLDDANGEC